MENVKFLCFSFSIERVEMLREIELEKIPFYKDGLIEGEKRGVIKGEKRGIVKGKVLVYSELGFSVEDIAKKVNISKEEVEKIIKGI